MRARLILVVIAQGCSNGEAKGSAMVPSSLQEHARADWYVWLGELQLQREIALCLMWGPVHWRPGE